LDFFVAGVDAVSIGFVLFDTLLSIINCLLFLLYSALSDEIRTPCLPCLPQAGAGRRRQASFNPLDIYPVGYISYGVYPTGFSGAEEFLEMLINRFYSRLEEDL